MNSKTPLLDAVKTAFIYVHTGTKYGPEIRVDDQIREALKRRHSKGGLSYALGGGVVGGFAGGALGLMANNKQLTLAGGLGGMLLGGILGKSAHTSKGSKIDRAKSIRGSLTRNYGMPSDKDIAGLYRNFSESRRQGDINLKNFSLYRYGKK